MATIDTARARAADHDRLEETWRQRIADAAEARKQIEPDWHEAMYFAAGRHWYEWSRTERRMVMPPSLAAQQRELYTADRINEYRMTALGEMTSDDERPELLLVKDDAWSEEYQRSLNRAVRHAWEHEWRADQALADTYRLLIDLGTAAIWNYWDPAAGPVVEENAPYHDGRLLSLEEAAALIDEGVRPEFREQREGRTCWRPLSGFHLLPPPGIQHERDFPYDIIVRPTPVEDIRSLFGSAASGVREDTDIGSLLGMPVDSRQADDGTRQRVRDHAWLYTVLVRACAKYPRGQQLTLVGGERQLIDVKDRLQKRGPGGEWRTGLTYFHWWRVTGRFWSRSLVESMEDSQRRINERATQNQKIIRRGMPKVFMTKGSLVNWPEGLPMEVVTVKEGQAAPNFFQGIGPGAWMQADIEQADNDIARATGIYGPSRGENPANVDTYSQLALIAENDQTKRQPIYREIKQNIKTLVEDGVHDIVAYWPPEKKVLATEDDENEVSADIFKKAPLERAFYVVKVANGAAKPRSQGAMLQLVNDLMNKSVESGQPLPLDWYKRSLEAGQPLDLPDLPMSEQVQVAQLENHEMLAGVDVQVAYYDNPDLHVPQHRMAQDQARAAGDNGAVQTIERHVQQHLAVAQQNAADSAAAGGGTLPIQPPTLDAQAGPAAPPEPGPAGAPAPSPRPPIKPAP